MSTNIVEYRLNIEHADGTHLRDCIHRKLCSRLREDTLLDSAIVDRHVRECFDLQIESIVD
jgi:hypothetical protein